MDPISGKIGEKGYIFSTILNKTAIYYDKASSKRITSEIIQAWSPPAEKTNKKFVFSIYCKDKATIYHDRANSFGFETSGISQSLRFRECRK